MTVNHDSSSADTEESVLMPESSPRRGLRRPKRLLAATEAGRYNDNQSEREYAALGNQLDALEHDIHDAREVLPPLAATAGLTTDPGLDVPTSAPRGQPVTLADGAQILIRAIERDSSTRASSTLVRSPATDVSSHRSTT
jgi:hypothetical protein